MSRETTVDQESAGDQSVQVQRSAEMVLCASCYVDITKMYSHSASVPAIVSNPGLGIS